MCGCNTQKMTFLQFLTFDICCGRVIQQAIGIPVELVDLLTHGQRPQELCHYLLSVIVNFFLPCYSPSNTTRLDRNEALV